ncbi:MAG: TolC family protein [Candidatus Omnitrophica bacterium]|nr:TolC family protein [Candidatus Omnitrophota bacterium]
MRIKRIIGIYFFVTLLFIVANPTISFSYIPSTEAISNYIIGLSKDISNSIGDPDQSALDDSTGELKLKMLLSPWGELKDAYISESSSNIELDNICLKAVWMYDKYQPFPEELGNAERWIDIPIIFDIKEYKGPRLMSRVSEPKEKDQTMIDLTMNMEDAVDVALENDMAVKIAQDEIELSRLKIREARRALYPAASLNYMETIGKTTGVAEDFTDKEYKVKFEYPLYYGWRLKYAVDQAVSNMKASRENYDKVRQDLRSEVETAFYSYLSAKASIKLQKSLLEDAEKIFDIAKKRYDIELSTRAEFLQVESQIKQIDYQLVSSENDLLLAKITLEQSMNIENIDGILGIDTDLESIEALRPIDVDVRLDECVELALRNRPDLRSKEHMLEFNEYEKKIAETKDQLKVDLTGTYGKSGGAYESESLNMDNDWYLGFKVSKPLGGNTLATSYTKDETSEKHGQTSRTGSVSRAFELSFLDNLQSFSEKKSASIAFKKAADELEQVRMAILKEVKETYLNYKKGIIQTRSNLNKIAQRREELKIAKARAELNEIALSELMQAHINLADERSYYIEAMGSLYQSLAKLNKATGYSLFIDDGSFRLAKGEIL